MTEPTDQLTAHESVWEYRIRQRIALERIILTVGNQREKLRARQFLEAMEQAHPGLLEDIDLHTPALLEDIDYQHPELFEDVEYSKATRRKFALKLPTDIQWEERTVRRAVKEYADLFLPCDAHFHDAMKGLQYLYTLHPELFARAREQAVAVRERILDDEIHCKCGCCTADNSRPAAAFAASQSGRFARVTQRIACARSSRAGGDAALGWDGTFFLDRIGEIAPEMLKDPARR